MAYTICKLPDETENEYYRLQVHWRDDDFTIYILQKEFAWKGHVSQSYLEKRSKLLHLTIQEYLKETKTALSTQNGAKFYTYLIQGKQFLWKKLDQSSNIKITYGFVELEKVLYVEAAEIIFDTIMKQYTDLQLKVEDSHTTNIMTTREKEVLMKQLVEYKKEKLKMEHQLMSQFLAVLNNKKEYIQELQTQTLNTEKTSTDTCKKSDDNSMKLPHDASDFGSKNIQDDHYNSDTEVENSDEELQCKSFAKERLNDKRNDIDSDDNDDLFNIKAPGSNVPERAIRHKRPVTQYIEPSSSRKLRKVVPIEYDSQELLDDF